MAFETQSLPREMSQTMSEVHAACFERPWSTSEFEELFEMMGVFGLWVSNAGEMAGFILLRQASDEAEILTLAVRPADQRNGCGRMLLTSALSLAKAKDCKEVFLEVAQDNKPALSLYLGCGFEQVGARPNYYSRPEASPSVDALVLRRPVADLAVEITK